MEHVVFYPSADGSPAFRRVGSLDEAVNFVEHIRNVEGVTDFSVHALTPVPLSFRAYYHVEVPATGTEGAAVPAAVSEPVAAVESAVVEPAPVESVPAAAAAPVESAPAPVVASPFAPPAPAAPTLEPFVPEPAVSAESAPAAVAEPVAPAAEAAPVDPSVEEVVPVPSGRRSMGFFARS